MCAYLYDERATQDAGAEFSPVAERLASAFQRDPLGADIFYRCAAADSLGDVVVRLAALLVPRGGRAVLRIVGHGSPGKVDVSKDRLTAESVWQMSPLAGQVQRIELHSCCVVASRENSYFDHRRTGGQFLPDFSPLADGDRDLAAYLRLGEIPSDVGRSIRGMRGVQLIAAMASTVRCAVRGAILTQVLDIRDWRFEGPTVTAFPGGTLFLDVSAGGGEDTQILGNRPGTYVIP